MHTPAAAIGGLRRRINRVVVVEGASYDPRHRAAQRTLADTRDPTAVAAALDALNVEQTEVALMTPGAPSLALMHDHELVALVRIKVLTYASCPELWGMDARLVDSRRLRAWLAEHVPERSWER